MGKVKLTGYKKRLYEVLKNFHNEEYNRLKREKVKLESSKVGKLVDAKEGLERLKRLDKELEFVELVKNNIKTGFFSRDIVDITIRNDRTINRDYASYVRSEIIKYSPLITIELN